MYTKVFIFFVYLRIIFAIALAANSENNVSEEKNLNPDRIKSTLEGFGKLPQEEIQTIDYWAKQYNFNNDEAFLLYFLRVYENGSNGNEYNILESFTQNAGFNEQCRKAAQFIKENSVGESQFAQFFARWVRYQKQYNAKYNKDSSGMYLQAKRLRSKL